MEQNEQNQIEESDLFSPKSKSKEGKKKADHVVYGQVSNANPDRYTDSLSSEELRAVALDKNEPTATRKVAIGRLGIQYFNKGMGIESDSMTESVLRLCLKVVLQGKTATLSPEGITFSE